MQESDEPLPLTGWREWVALPEFGIPRIKAKIDTGARSSSLHAFDVVQTTDASGATRVRFCVHPRQRDDRKSIEVEAAVLEFRHVRSSSGVESHRPVIVTSVAAFGRTWPIELTLADRDAMGFRMLLGREAIRGRFLVDPGSSYLGGGARRTRVKKPAD